MLQTSNPNRSVLINRSLINSRKQISEEDLSNEISLEHSSGEALNGSVLGTMRSTEDFSSSKNYSRRNRTNNLSLDISKAIKMHCMRDHIPSKESIGQEASLSQDSHKKRRSFDERNTQRPFSTQHLPNRFDMRLDLSKVMKVNSFDKIPQQLKDLEESKPGLKKETKKTELKYKFGKLELPMPMMSSTNRNQVHTENKFFMTVPTEHDVLPMESVKYSTNQTLNSFVHHLGNISNVSSCRNQFASENPTINEILEGTRKV